MSQEIMVVLGDGGKPMTVVRTRDPAKPQPPVEDRAGWNGLRRGPVAIPAGSPLTVPLLQPKRQQQPSTNGDTAPSNYVKKTISQKLPKETMVRSKDFEDQVELRRLRVENRILQQRIDKLEKAVNQSNMDHSSNGGVEAKDHIIPSQCDSKSDIKQLPVPDSRQRMCSESTESDSEMQRLQDELVACKLREAESNLAMKEFEQRLNQLERHWQHFLCESRSDNEGKSPPQPDLKETVMGLRLRETHLFAGMNDLKTSLMELETQNHIYERQIKRQQAENAALIENLAAAETREHELRTTIIQLERKISNLESSCQEGAAMSRIRDAECSQSLEEMRRQIAELEIENQELLTAARLHQRDGSGAETGMPGDNHEGAAEMFDGMSDNEDDENEDEIISSSNRRSRHLADDIDAFDLPDAISSLRLSTDNFMTSSFLVDPASGLPDEKPANSAVDDDDVTPEASFSTEKSALDPESCDRTPETSSGSLPADSSFAGSEKGNLTSETEFSNLCSKQKTSADSMQHELLSDVVTS